MSILEVSHRSKAFEEILAGCEADLRTLGGVLERAAEFDLLLPAIGKLGAFAEP